MVSRLTFFSNSGTNSDQQTNPDVTLTHHTEGAQVPDYKSIPAATAAEEGTSEESEIAATSVITPLHCKIQWFLQIACYTGVLFITLIYWIGVSAASGDAVSAYILHVHGVTLLIALVDVMLVANPTRLWHCIYACLFAVLYCMFTVFYWVAGGTNGRIPDSAFIYKGILDWEEAPGTTVVVFLISIFILVPLCHLLFFGLYRLKCVLYRRYVQNA